MTDPTSVRILHADDSVVVVDKPSGLVVHRGWAREPVVVMSLVRDALDAWVYPVHRLDRGTSGALVFARTPEAQRVLSRAFEEQAVEKRYLALVRGRFTEAQTIDYAIPRTEDGERVPAITDVTPLHVLPYYSLVEARPRTGRLHQVRRHLKHVGHPIVMDKKHGRGVFNEVASRDYGIDRMALHARSITFPHPDDGRSITVDAPWIDLVDRLEAMGIPRELLV